MGGGILGDLSPQRRRLLARLLAADGLSRSAAERFGALLGDEPGEEHEAVPILAGVVADRYRIEREIGRGGMATVFLAEDLSPRGDERLVAIKALDPAVVGSVAADRFRREIDVLLTLSHPNILPLLDSGREGEILFYVMPYIEGESLRERLARDGALRVDEACGLAAEIADALGHAHSHDVVHRDVKPANILLRDGHALVADFGVARAIERASRAMRLTVTGLVVGTPSYMSPEQASGGKASPASDVYSLGRVLGEMLGGAAPAEADPLRVLVARRRGEEPALTLPPHVPSRVAAVVWRALELDRDRRFRSATEMAAAIRRAVRPTAWDRVLGRVWGQSS